MKTVVIGATERLGRLVVEGLLQRVAPSQVLVAVRSLEGTADLAARGVEVRVVDPAHPETWKAALAGTQKVLLVGSSEPGAFDENRAVIEAAKKAHVRLFVYTSVLHAENTHLAAAAEHRSTERLLHASGLHHVVLRNGPSLEDFTEQVQMALGDGALIGSAGEGRVAAAGSEDYAAAAIAVLTGTGHENKVYELVGERPFSMADLAEEISRLAGRTIFYDDLSPEDHRELLTAGGMPERAAALLVDAHLAIRRGEMKEASEDLRRLIGRHTMTLADAVARTFAR